MPLLSPLLRFSSNSCFWMSSISSSATISFNSFSKALHFSASSSGVSLQIYPNFLVADWLGHSVEVQEAHYAKVRPEDYLRAAGVQTAHKTAQHLPAPDALSLP